LDRGLGGERFSIGALGLSRGLRDHPRSVHRCERAVGVRARKSPAHSIQWAGLFNGAGEVTAAVHNQVGRSLAIHSASLRLIRSRS
jgi:hypothetical protein